MASQMKVGGLWFYFSTQLVISIDRVDDNFYLFKYKHRFLDDGDNDGNCLLKVISLYVKTIPLFVTYFDFNISI